jgi:hypothetical protein
MLGNQTFDHNMIRKYVVAFGTLFNEIFINTKDGDEVIKTLKVPLSYAEKDKLMARVLGDPTIDNKVATTLPRMSFEMTNISYDGSRKFSKIMKVGRSGADSGVSAFNPVPYNLNFSLYIAVKNTEDGTKIVEQILPNFTPDWNVTANLVPGLDAKVDIPIILDNVSKEDSYDGDYKTRRAIIWTLNFTVKGYIFGPLTDRKRIETAIIDIFDDNKVPAALAATITTTVDGVDIEEF